MEENSNHFRDSFEYSKYTNINHFALLDPFSYFDYYFPAYTTREIPFLKKLMDEAVECEDYLEAARYRDIINSLTKAVIPGDSLKLTTPHQFNTDSESAKGLDLNNLYSPE